MGPNCKDMGAPFVSFFYFFMLNFICHATYHLCLWQLLWIIKKKDRYDDQNTFVCFLEKVVHWSTSEDDQILPLLACSCGCGGRRTAGRLLLTFWFHHVSTPNHAHARTGKTVSFFFKKNPWKRLSLEQWKWVHLL